MSALGDILPGKLKRTLCAGTQIQSGQVRGKPSCRKKMRGLSHFFLSAKKGFIGRNTQPAQGIIELSNLMILNKIKS
ncbi:hypothetical protein SB6419_01911 [Klebsiella spallanzanii]|nr:hypothetical protein SB6419_01911 [Klebsiella spallanzanii]